MKFKNLLYQYKLKWRYARYEEFIEDQNNILKDTPENIQKISIKRAVKIAQYAFKNIPFYQKKYKKYGVSNANDITEVSFQNLPVLTKQDVRESYDYFYESKNVNRLKSAATGGSTGEPLKFRYDSSIPYIVNNQMILNWWGVNCGENAIVIRRSPLTGMRLLRNSIFWYPTKNFYLDAALMTEKTMGEMVKKIKRINSCYITGYVGAIYEFALYIQKNEIEVESIKAVWTTSAPLANFQRQIMEKIFNAKVYNQYGSCENPWLASECSKQNGMHIFSHIRYLEFVNDENKNVGASQIGNILVTNTIDYCFPFIRYQTGDRSKLLSESCSCGLPFPLMSPVKGRETDCIVLPDKSIVSGDYLTTLFDEFPNAITAFQICQKKDMKIELLVVPNTKYANNLIEIEKVTQKLTCLIKNQILISVICVPEIPHDKGKTRFIIHE